MFGSVAVEAQLCGTPVICTPMGAFTETVEHGITGFRCHTLGEFMAATEAVKKLDRAAIRKRAIEKYSTQAIAPQYEAYFRRIALLNGGRGLESDTGPGIIAEYLK